MCVRLQEDALQHRRPTGISTKPPRKPIEKKMWSCVFGGNGISQLPCSELALYEYSKTNHLLTWFLRKPPRDWRKTTKGSVGNKESNSPSIQTIAKYTSMQNILSMPIFRYAPVQINYQIQPHAKQMPNTPPCKAIAKKTPIRWPSPRYRSGLRAPLGQDLATFRSLEQRQA